MFNEARMNAGPTVLRRQGQQKRKAMHNGPAIKRGRNDRGWRSRSSDEASADVAAAGTPGCGNSVDRTADTTDQWRRGTVEFATIGVDQLACMSDVAPHCHDIGGCWITPARGGARDSAGEAQERRTVWQLSQLHLHFVRSREGGTHDPSWA